MKKSRFGICAVFALIFVLLLVFNFLTPMTADDFLFTFSRWHWGRITAPDEIIPSMIALRQNTNGRVLAHFFVQLFLFWPRPVFNVLNAGMGTLLFYILYRYVRRGEPGRDLLLAVLLVSQIFVLVPAFGQVFLWLTGACNYSWTILVTLGFLYPFLARYTGREVKMGAAARMLYLPLGFAAGAWSENGSLAMLCAAFAFLGLSWLREKKLPRFLAGSFLVSCLGFLFLMSAPSEWSGRRGEVAESTLTKAAVRLAGRFSPAALAGIAVLALLALTVFVWLLLRKRTLGCRLGSLGLGLGLALALVLFARRSGSVGALASETPLLLLAAGCLWGMLLLRGLEKALDKRILLAALLLGLAGLASVLIFLVAVYFPARSACPFVCYTSLADALLLAALWDRGEKADLKRFAAVFAALALLLMPLAAADIAAVHHQSVQRESYLRSLEGSGADVIVEPIVTRSKYPATWPGDESYFDGDIAWYYGLGSYRVTEYAND